MYADIAVAVSLLSLAMVARFFRMRNFSRCRVEPCPAPSVGGAIYYVLM